MDDLNIWITILVAIIGFIIGKLNIGLKFDINKWQEERKKRLTMNYQNTCPHIFFHPNGKPEILYQSPAGTLNWICRQCRHTRIDRPSSDEFTHLLKNPDDYIKRYKKLKKLSKKLGYS